MTENDDVCKYRTENEDDEARAEEDMIAALERVEQYLELQEAVAALLKSGWFNIARARHAMGRNQVSSTMYKSALEAQTVVIPSASEKVHQPTERLHSQQQLPLPLQPDTACSTNISAQSSKDQLRPHPNGSVFNSVLGDGTQKTAAMRLQPPCSDTVCTSQAAAEASGDGQSWRVEFGSLQSCLRMFGAAPSPYLRTAQSDFVAATRLIPRLAKARHCLLSAALELKDVTESAL